MDTPKGGNRVLRLSAVLALCMAAQLACSLADRPAATATRQQLQDPPLPSPSGTPQQPEDSPPPPPTGTPSEPTSSPTEEYAGNHRDGFACFASQVGVVCLTDAGWQTYTEENSDLPTNILNDLAACPDGKIYGAKDKELVVFDGVRWSTIPIDGDLKANSLVCGPDGTIWITYRGGIGRYRQQTWTMIASSEFATGHYPDLVRSIAIAPDGTVWVTTEDSISAYDGKSWKEYKQGDGFLAYLNFGPLAVDSTGRVWVYDYKYLYWLEEGEWEKEPVDRNITYYSMTTDSSDRVWLNTSVGVLIFDGSGWKTLSYTTGEIHSNGVHDAVFDGSGRTWLAMNYGIDVLSSGSWIHYRMDNSDLADNMFFKMAVTGDGPALPPFRLKNNGSLTGRVTLDGEPLKHARVEFCVEFVAPHSKDSPCDGQPLVYAATTDAEGSFSVVELPPGYFFIAVDAGEIGWIGGVGRKLVREGQETNIGVFSIRTP